MPPPVDPVSGTQIRWEVAGADRVTGIDKSLVIEADNEASATRRGNRAGLLVASVRPIDPDDSVVGISIRSKKAVANVMTPVAPAVIESRPAPRRRVVPRWITICLLLGSMLAVAAGLVYRHQVAMDAVYEQRTSDNGRQVRSTQPATAKVDQDAGVKIPSQ